MEVYDSEGNAIHVEERTNGFWSKIGGGSLMIAALFHIILLIAGAFWIFQVIYPPEKKIDFLPPGGGGGERGAEHQVQQKKRAQITPSTNVKRVFAEGAQSTFSIPEQGDNFGEMTTLSSLSGGGMSGLGGSGSGHGFGKGNGNGGGLGFGGGGGKLFGLIPENMRKRCSREDRLERLKQNGGTAACEEAVAKSLNWLKSVQNADGSWGDTNRAAMTGFALLAYFGHCETPISPDFGDSSMKGIVYLVNLALANDGRMASNFTANHWSYEHAIATYALGEAATFCKDLKIDVPQLQEMTKKAGQFIIDNQNQKGGWAYLYATDGGHVDVSVTGWQIQALKACDHTGIIYPRMKSCIDKSLKFIAECQAGDGGIGYENTAPSGGLNYHTLTGVGALCYQMWGKGSRPEVRKGVDYILKNTKFDYNSKFCDLYGHYYESQVMMQRGGDAWRKYNDIFRDQVLNNQDADGSWKNPGGGQQPRAVAANYIGGTQESKIYRTALCTLMLEVYYRFLSTDGGGLRSSGI